MPINPKSILKKSSREYLRECVDGYLQQAGVTKTTLSRSAGFPPNYLSMLSSRKEDSNDKLSIDSIPRLASVLPTLDPLKMLLIRLREEWGKDTTRLIVEMVRRYQTPERYRGLCAFLDELAEENKHLGVMPAVDGPEKRAAVEAVYHRLHELEAEALEAKKTKVLEKLTSKAGIPVPAS